MKKLFILLLVVTLVVCLSVSPVRAAEDEGKGAVKTVLVETASAPDWIIAGSLVLNTTASGVLIVNISMDTEPYLEDYDVMVVVLYSPPPVPPLPSPPPPDVMAYFDDVLDTNPRGHGNVHLTVPVDPPEENEYIWVSVSIREMPATSPTPPRFSNMPPPVMVPLK